MRAVACLFLLSSLPCLAGDNRGWIDLRKHPSYVFYTEGGCTSRQLKERYRVRFTCCGGYSAYLAPRKHRVRNCPICRKAWCKRKKLVGLDLVWIKGDLKVPYRSDLGRPILVFTLNGQARIDRPRRGWHPRSGDKCAMAGNLLEKMPDPNRLCWRQFVLISQDHHKVRIVKIKASDAKKCYRIARQCGVTEHGRIIALDGASAAEDGASNPVNYGFD